MRKECYCAGSDVVSCLEPLSLPPRHLVSCQFPRSLVAAMRFHISLFILPLRVAMLPLITSWFHILYSTYCPVGLVYLPCFYGLNVSLMLFPLPFLDVLMLTLRFPPCWVCSLWANRVIAVCHNDSFSPDKSSSPDKPYFIFVRAENAKSAGKLRINGGKAAAAHCLILCES